VTISVGLDGGGALVGAGVLLALVDGSNLAGGVCAEDVEHALRSTHADSRVHILWNFLLVLIAIRIPQAFRNLRNGRCMELV